MHDGNLTFFFLYFPVFIQGNYIYPNILLSVNGWIYILWQKGKNKYDFSILQPVY